MKRFELPRTPAQWLEAVMNAIFFLCGILAVGCVAVITISVSYTHLTLPTIYAV